MRLEEGTAQSYPLQADDALDTAGHAPPAHDNTAGLRQQLLSGATMASADATLAQAGGGDAAGGKLGAWETAKAALSFATPDALVYSNGALLTPPNDKTFFLANPSSGNLGSYTKFVSHPRSVVGNALGQRWNAVESITVNTDGSGTRREAGVGFAKKIGTGDDAPTFFFNVRGGDTNLANVKNGASVNFGVFGSADAVKPLLDKLPRGGAIERALDAGHTQLGVAYRGQWLVDKQTGDVSVKVSGVEVPLEKIFPDLQPGNREVKSLNYSDKALAHLNNNEAYVNGANPFQQAEATRAADGTYLNHGDPVAAIAGDVLSLQHKLEPEAEPIRSNAQARTFLEKTLDRTQSLSPDEAVLVPSMSGSDPPRVDRDPMTTDERSAFEKTLSEMERYGVYFASPELKEAAHSGAQLQGVEQADPATQEFTQQVFEGQFRDNAEPYGWFDGARDAALALSHRVAVAIGVTDIIDAGPVADDDAGVAKADNAAEGFAARMQREGGLLTALDIEVADGESRQLVEQEATKALMQALTRLCEDDGIEPTPQALYEQWQGLDDSQRDALRGAIGNDAGLLNQIMR
jgi:hypothetical protein